MLTVNGEEMGRGSQDHDLCIDSTAVKVATHILVEGKSDG